LEFLSSFFFVVLYINLSAKAKESLILNFKDMPKEQGTLAQVLSVQEQVIGREESETSHQELPLTSQINKRQAATSLLYLLGSMV